MFAVIMKKKNFLKKKTTYLQILENMHVYTLHVEIAYAVNILHTYCLWIFWYTSGEQATYIQHTQFPMYFMHTD